MKLFGRPGHGAPTGNNRKKIFTEHQLTESDLKIKTQAEQNSSGFGWTSAASDPINSPPSVRLRNSAPTSTSADSNGNQAPVSLYFFYFLLYCGIVKWRKIPPEQKNPSSFEHCPRTCTLSVAHSVLKVSNKTREETSQGPAVTWMTLGPLKCPFIALLLHGEMFK